MFKRWCRRSSAQQFLSYHWLNFLTVKKFYAFRTKSNEIFLHQWCKNISLDLVLKAQNFIAVVHELFNLSRFIGSCAFKPIHMAGNFLECPYFHNVRTHKTCGCILLSSSPPVNQYLVWGHISWSICIGIQLLYRGPTIQPQGWF